MAKLSHINSEGKARMVDVGDKSVTTRQATASVEVLLNSETYQAVCENRLAKGDLLGVARVAGIQAAKKTADLIPLCHPVPLNMIAIEFEMLANSSSIRIIATAKADHTTGVEMEAFTACSIAALTIYDMVKGIQKDVVISNLSLQRKTGGKSGDYQRHNS